MADSKSWNTDGDLNFVTEWQENAQLDFIVGDAVIVPPEIDIAGASYIFPPLSSCTIDYITNVDCSSTIEQPISSGKLDLIIEIQSACTIAAPTSDCTVINDINVDRSMKAEYVSSYDYADSLHNDLNTIYSDSPKLFNDKTVPIREGYKAQLSVTTLQGDLPQCFDNVEFLLLYGGKVQGAVSSVNIEMGKVRPECEFTVYDGDNLIPEQIQDSYFYPPRSDCAKSTYWMELDNAQLHVQADFEDGLPIKKSWANCFEDAITPTLLRPYEPVEPDEPDIEPLKPSLDFLRLWDRTGELDFLYIELDAVIIMNNITMYHTSDEGVKTYLNPTTWSITSDLDSYAWTLTCSLYDEGVLALITSDDLFTLEVNGIAWSFNAFKYKRVQAQQYTGYSVTFVSATQKLGSPYCELKNVSLDNPIGAIQLAESVLGDFPLINNGVTEWTLQADTVEYMDAEPKAIVSAIMAAAGAVMLPSTDGNSIKIQPRYKVAAWELAGITDDECDVLIDGNYMISDSGEITNGTEYNAVTISGESGVMTKVIRSGTDGATEATEFSTPLHQDHSTAIDYATKIFSESGTLELATISVGLDDNLLESGAIVRIKSNDGDRTGISLGCTVSGDSVDHVFQTATIEFRL